MVPLSGKTPKHSTIPWRSRRLNRWSAALSSVVDTRLFRAVVAVVLCAFALWFAIYVRRTVLNAQRQPVPASAEVARPMHFTLESALAFRRIKQAFRDGDLPARDTAIEYPEGIDPRADDTVLATTAYAAAARAWPGLMPLEERVRWLELLWWSLSIPALFCAVRLSTRGSTAAAIASTLLYAVSLAAVARTTGQELSHENNAWPLFLLHLAFWHAAGLGTKRPGWRYFWGIMGAAVLGLSLCLWDLMRYYIAAIALFTAARAAVGRLPKREALAFHVPLAAAVLLVGVLDPYHRAHHLLLSPLTALLVATPLTTFVHSRPAAPHHAAAPDATPRRRTLAIRLGLLLLLPALAAAAGFLLYRNESYGHFLSLFVAKVRYLNIRPLDPAKLTFAQRVLWTPSLHSTSARIFVLWFPAAFWVATIGAVLAFWTRAAKFLFDVPAHPVAPLGERLSPGTAAPSDIYLGPLTPTFLACFHLLSLAATILFFRFHVFLALTSSILAGFLVTRLAMPGPWRGVRTLAALALFGVIFTIEASPDFLEPDRFGRPDTYAKEADALVEALRREVTPDPVLASFGISSTIAAYADCPVILQPKFETARARRGTEEFWNVLFTGTEDAFADFMNARRAVVYVHALGALSNVGWELSPRYMVNALNPPANAVVRAFDGNAPEKKLRRFRLLYANRKYRVFRLLPDPANPDDAPAALAADYASRGLQAHADGDLPLAAAYALAALRADPSSPSAQALSRLLPPDWQATADPADL